MGRPSRSVGHQSVRNCLGLCVVALLLAPVLFIMVTNSPAGASTTGTICQGQNGGQQAHDWSVGSYCTTINTGYQGTWASNYFNLDLSQYQAGGLFTHEIWDATGTKNGYPFVETGLINAEDGANHWYNPCGSTCIAYQIFWADLSGGGFYYFHWVSNISPGAGTFNYALLWAADGTSHWNVVVDGFIVGTSTVQSSSVAQFAEDGMEVFPATGPINSNDYSATFDQPTKELILGTWFTEAWSGTANGAPCGPLPNGLCSNGVSYGPSEWSSNVPG